MIVFLLKFIACTGVLLLFYYGFLQNEKLFRFNRFFLFAIVVLSLVIPITIVRTKIIDVPVYEAPVYTQMETLRSDREDFMAIPLSVDTVNESLLTLANVLWISYLLVTSLLLIRFMRNLFTILKLKRESLIVVENGVKIVLRNDIKASFSFLSHMYTNRARYEQGKLPIEIIEHEKHHIDQKHSYDIIYIELVQCLLWFNPFIYLIRGAIKLNHEFLADEHVLRNNLSVYDYQKILLDITRKQFVTTPAFASNLNYGFTKKRLNMMTKNTNKFKSMIKQVAAFGIIACTFWLAGETQVIAQSAPEIAKRPITTLHSISFDKNNLITRADGTKYAVMSMAPFGAQSKIRFKLDNEDVIKSFSELSYTEKSRIIKEKIRIEHFVESTKAWIHFGLKFKDVLNKQSQPEQDTIKPKIQESKVRFKSMGSVIKNSRVRFKDQNGELIEKKYQDLTNAEEARFKDLSSSPQFFLPPPPRGMMNQALLDDFMDPKKYGVWMDGKRIDNGQLAIFSPEEFHHFTKRELKSNAQDYGKYQYRLNLTSITYFDAQPYANGQWRDYELPKIIEIPEQKTSKDKGNQEPSEVAAVKNKKLKEKTKDQSNTQELAIKKGGFNPELHSPGIDLEKVEYFLAPTFSAHLKYTDNSGRSVVKTFGEMTDEEYSMWVNPKNNGQIFNPPAPKEEITMSRLIELKNQEEIEFWINGKKAEPQAIVALRYHEIYDMTVTETKADIITDLVFLQDDSAWMSRIKYKKVE